MGKISYNYSPNFSPIKRISKNIKYIVFHYTGMKSEKAAINRLTDVKSKVSSHFFIQRNGNIILMVPEKFVAWHAGVTNWKNVKSLNNYSLGIEIQNFGHKHGYQSFTKRQIASIVKITKYLKKKYNIKKSNLLGHSDIAINRKLDPGEKFPWKILAKSNLAKWHKLSEKKIQKHRLIKLNSKEENFFLKNLDFIGYKKIKTLNSNLGKKFLYKAFQRRFRQSLINGIPDKECLLISKNLVKS